MRQATLLGGKPLRYYYSFIIYDPNHQAYFLKLFYLDTQGSSRIFNEKLVKIFF
jgi:hypothetical protein